MVCAHCSDMNSSWVFSQAWWKEAEDGNGRGRGRGPGAGGSGREPSPRETARPPAVRGPRCGLEPSSWLHLSSLLCKVGMSSLPPLMGAYHPATQRKAGKQHCGGEAPTSENGAEYVYSLCLHLQRQVIGKVTRVKGKGLPHKNFRGQASWPFLHWSQRKRIRVALPSRCRGHGCPSCRPGPPPPLDKDSFLLVWEGLGVCLEKAGAGRREGGSQHVQILSQGQRNHSTPSHPL